MLEWVKHYTPWVNRTHGFCVLFGYLVGGVADPQRMYVKRGYIPDSSGVWYNDRVCDQYAPCVNDDDLVLYLIKDLNKE